MPKTTLKSILVQDTDNDTQIQVEKSADEDKIRFDTAGTERVIIDQTGKVGVGTSAPIAKLDVAGKIAITLEASTPDQPLDGQGYVYSKSDGKLYWRSHDLAEVDLTFSGGSGISFDGNTADGILTYKDSDEATVESNLTFDGSTLAVSGDIEVAEYVKHAGDNDTFIQFADDAIGITAGGEQLITISEAGQDIVTIGDGGDVDFRVRTENDDNTLYIEGNTDRIGIGTNSPSSILHIKEAGPTLTFQRENNSNASTINFLGAEGNTANSIIHNSSTNDLIFKTFNGSAVEEILRLGDHYGASLRQVVILSGSSMAPPAMQPRSTSDIAFFVSGSIGSRGTSTRGVSVFGGDLVVSGSINAAGGSLTFAERSSDPANPAEGNSVLWMSDGTAAGDDGDIMIKITAGGVTKTVTLVDFSSS